MSDSGDRLCQVCSVFLRVSKAFVQSQQLSFSDFDSVNNSFTFPPMVDNGSSIHQLADNLGFPFHDTGYGYRKQDMQQMSQFLNTFLSDRQSYDGLWDLNTLDNSR